MVHSQKYEYSHKATPKRKYQFLLYGEGRNDKDFLYALTELSKFKYHTKKWTPPIIDNASGGPPDVVLEKCKRSASGISYDLIICFVDVDILLRNYGSGFEKKKSELEEIYSKYNIKIVWQSPNLEGELRKIIGSNFGKHRLNAEAKKNINKFINSDHWKTILEHIRQRERELEKEQLFQR
jgi:hypothetical protein